MYPEATKILNTRLKEQWTETFIHWEGVGKEGELPVEPGESFIRPTIDWVDRSGRVGGMGKKIGIGYVLIEIYTEYGNGRLKADRFAQELTDIFKDFEQDALEVTSINPPETVGQENTGFYHLNLQINFKYSECREV